MIESYKLICFRVRDPSSPILALNNQCSFGSLGKPWHKMASLLKDDGTVGGGMRDGLGSTRVAVLGDFCTTTEDESKHP